MNALGEAVALAGAAAGVAGLFLVAAGFSRAAWSDWREHRHLRRDMARWDRLADEDRKRAVS